MTCPGQFQHLGLPSYFQPDIPKEQVVGKTIARILQSEWEFLKDWDFCRFYIETSAGTLFELGESYIYSAPMTLLSSLHGVEREGRYPPFWAADGTTGIGDVIEGAFCMHMKQFGGDVALFLELTGDRFLHAVIEEGGMRLDLFDRANLLRHYSDLSRFRDYWSDSPYF